MIIKGAARGNAGWLADHLERTDTNEVAEVVEIRGVVARTTRGAFREIAATALCTKARDPLYHANIDPRADETLTRAQWAQAVDALERKLGFQGQPRVVVRHIKEGREHLHVVWSRIDVEKRRAIPDSHNYRKHEEVARALEREFGHARVQGAHAERDGVARPARTPSRAEMQQAERSQIDPKAVKAELSALWQQTDTGKAFAAALEDAGYCLARGDKRDFIVVDQAGEVHSLARRIDGAKAKDIRVRMGDIDPAGLPDAEGAKAIQAGRAQARGELAPPIAAEGPAAGVPQAEPPPPAVPPEPVSDVDSAAAARRRQLLAAAGLPQPREPVALPEPTGKGKGEDAPAAPVPPPVLPEDARKADRRRELLDAVQAARGRERVPEAAPVVPEPAPAGEQAPPPVATVPDQPAKEAVPLPAGPASEPLAPELPAHHEEARRKQALDAAEAEAEEKRRRAAQREAEEEEERRRRRNDARIEQEEAQLVVQQARQDVAERKALQEQQRAEWRRLEQTEASRARRDSIEDDGIAAAQTTEDDEARPRGLFVRIKNLFSPAAARERKEQQQQIAAQRIRDHADRLAQRRTRDAEARALLTAAQARNRETAEKARAERQAFEREELRKRQREREEREREREARAREGRGEEDGREDGGRGGGMEI
jgi:hypothetical protein